MPGKTNSDIDLTNFQPSEFFAFKDMEVCKKVENIKKEDIAKPPKVAHPDFKIRIYSTNQDLRF